MPDVNTRFGITNTVSITVKRKDGSIEEYGVVGYQGRSRWMKAKVKARRAFNDARYGLRRFFKRQIKRVIRRH